MCTVCTRDSGIPDSPMISSMISSWGTPWVISVGQNRRKFFNWFCHCFIVACNFVILCGIQWLSEYACLWFASSLVDSLTENAYINSGKYGEQITDGIDIKTWIAHTNDDSISFSVWDFAGQTVYYNTHQVYTLDTWIYLCHVIQFTLSLQKGT